MNPERRVERLKQRLGLSDDQAASIAEVYSSSVRGDRAERAAKIKAILTPEQLTKYEAMRKGRRGRRGPRG